jgi:hypothetical protein
MVHIEEAYSEAWKEAHRGTQNELYIAFRINKVLVESKDK